MTYLLEILLVTLKFNYVSYENLEHKKDLPLDYGTVDHGLIKSTVMIISTNSYNAAPICHEIEVQTGILKKQ